MPRAPGLTAVLLLGHCLVLPGGAGADTLDTIQQRGALVWGADREGGAPYVYPDPAHPAEVTGFEVELAALVAGRLHVAPRYFAGPWQYLPDLLHNGQIDVVLNGYELTAARTANMAATRPYFVYELRLIARADDPRLRDWDDLISPATGRRPVVGTLSSSAAYFYLQRICGSRIDLRGYEGNVDAMGDVETGKLDATVADTPVAQACMDRFRGLRMIGEPRGRGYYVMYVRPEDRRLRDALDQALGDLLASGELERLYERYQLWSPVQETLRDWTADRADAATAGGARLRGWQVIHDRGWLLVQGAGVTVQLACLSMPLAMAMGLALALFRVYGPAAVRWLAIGWIELLRGTPLLLQLYLIFYVLPDFGLRLPAFAAAILGLAINYSAYEAEIYRAGLNAIPRTQMEAALSLGMSRGLALRRVIIPQAVRLVIPPVTNDFIALFKDTSVCSIITVSELTKQYSEQRNDTGANLELAVLTAILYLLMSIPLARLASWLERRRGELHE